MIGNNVLRFETIFFSSLFKFHFFNFCFSILYSILIFFNVTLGEEHQVLHLFNLHFLLFLIVDPLTLHSHQLLPLLLAFLLGRIQLPSLILEYLSLLRNLLLVLLNHWHLSLIENIHLKFSLADFANHPLRELFLGVSDRRLTREWALLLGAVFAGFQTTEGACDVVSARFLARITKLLVFRGWCVRVVGLIRNMSTESKDWIVGVEVVVIAVYTLIYLQLDLTNRNVLHLLE